MPRVDIVKEMTFEEFKKVFGAHFTKEEKLKAEYDRNMKKFKHRKHAKPDEEVPVVKNEEPFKKP